MKTLQLIKHIASELIKGNRIVKHKLDDGQVIYADGYKLWIINEKDDIFNDKVKEYPIDRYLYEKDINNLKIIDNYIVIDGTNIVKNKKLARGVIDGIDFYFDIDYLKYFDKECKLYKCDNDPLSPVYIKDKTGRLGGLIMPVRLEDKTKKEISKKLGL